MRPWDTVQPGFIKDRPVTARPAPLSRRAHAGVGRGRGDEVRPGLESKLPTTTTVRLEGPP
jgi:hypothetical protein